MAKYKVFVGTDTSQQLAVKVLEHSIKKYASEDVDVIPMCDLPVPVPKLVRNQQRTGFSFSRFCIPKLMNYQGKAIYVDADMQVFSDIMEIFNWPMNNHKIIIQKPLEKTEADTHHKIGAPKKRIRQCSVMLIDCEKAHWDVEEIVAGLDQGRYNYEQLMYELCILKEDEIGEELPFTWNSLEQYDKNTQLIHYTDMKTQPWVSTRNVNGWVWFKEVREMLRNGSLKEEDVAAEIKKGYFRPSLLIDVKHYNKIPSPLFYAWAGLLHMYDSLLGYEPHKEVYERSGRIKKALKEEQRMAGLSMAQKA
ncbi:MAG: glycosyl transferase [Bdellovibrionaceae bacterium]|nr:glycosyl transferase [Pseudobdellovibrionaceae bacterium]